jgi:hypothetical protein
MNAQNLQSSVESAGQLELLVKDRDHQIGADRNPDLGLHRVGGGRCSWPQILEKTVTEFKSATCISEFNRLIF